MMSRMLSSSRARASERSVSGEDRDQPEEDGVAREDVKRRRGIRRASWQPCSRPYFSVSTALEPRRVVRGSLSAAACVYTVSIPRQVPKGKPLLPCMLS